MVSFRTYVLLALGTVSLVTTAYLGYGHHQRLEEAVIESTNRDLDLTAEGLARSVRQEILFHRTAIEALAAIIETADSMDPQLIRLTLAQHRARFAGLDITFVADATGTAIASDPELLRGFPVAGTTYNDRDYVQAVREKHQTALSPRVQVGKRSGRPNVHIASPIMRGGVFAGFAAESIGLERFESLASLAVGPIRQGTAVLLDKDGRVIAHSRDSSRVQAELGAFPVYALGASALRTGSDEDGNNVRAAVRELPELQWRVAVLQPSSITAERLGASRRTTAIAIVITLALALIASYVLAGVLTRPLSRLAAFAISARTNPSATPPRARRGDPREVRVLESALRELLGKLVGRAEQLEVEVEARTRSLAEANRRLEANVQQLVTAERLASIGQLAAGVAHEINNPITYVLGSQAQLQAHLQRLAPLHAAIEAGADGATARAAYEAAGGRALFDECNEAAAEVHDGALRVRAIVRDVWSLSRVTADSSEVFDATESLRAGLRLAGVQIRHASVITQELSEGLFVAGNSGRLAQVFVNLLVNAAQARPAKGESRIRVKSERVGDRVCISVTDNGPGIAPQNVGRLFEPFFTTKSSGTGLGLAISRDAVRAMGGDIRLETGKGTGTTFTVELPYAGAIARSGMPAIHVPEPAGKASTPAQKPRILFVEDEPSIRRGYQRVLGRRYDVVIAEDGVAACKLLSDGERFDIVVSDLLMPNMNGIELYRRIREQRPELVDAFVFVTGGTSEPSIQAFLASITTPVLEKPFELQELAAAIDARLARLSQRPATDPGQVEQNTPKPRFGVEHADRGSLAG